MEGHRQGGPPVKEVLLLSRRFSCQGGWDREKEEERRIEGERDRSAVHGSNVERDKQGGPPVKDLFCESMILFLRIHDSFSANP